MPVTLILKMGSNLQEYILIKKMYHWNDKWTLYVYLFGGLGMDQGEIILSWWETKKTKSDKRVTSWDIRGPLRAVGIGD